MTCILGCDPGISGALAWYFDDIPEQITAEDVPVVGKELDAVTLAQRIRQMCPDVAYVEDVHAMPKQGVSSTFKFGRAFGVLTGVLQALEVPIVMVSPTVWKRHYRLKADKEEARTLALRHWPSSDRFSRKKDHGRAEAALLARYGAMQSQEVA